MATPDAVRSLIKIKLKNGIPIPPGEFHPLDLERINDDKYLMRILDAVDNDLKLSTDKLWDILVWRKTVGANDINESTINMEYVNDGTIFTHGRDVEGGLLLIIKVKTHTRGKRDMNELKKIIIYYFDRAEREEDGKQISMFFDLDGCGLSNMDLELVRFLITLEKYYPQLVKYIIIFEVPWVLSPSIKIIKALLSEKAVKVMKFLNKDTLKEIVAPDQALTCWGGKNNYVFKFVPEKRKPTTRTIQNGSLSEFAHKKVTFAHHGSQDSLGDSQYSPGEMLRLDPSDIISFQIEEEDMSGQFTITNMDESVIAYKIKTTSPEKFLARPNAGTLTSGGSQTIQITIQPGFQSYGITRDRFLVASVQIPKLNISQKELTEIWRRSSGSQIDEYRLKCKFPDKETSVQTFNSEQSNIEIKLQTITNALLSLQINNDNLLRQSKRTKFYQIITLIMTVIAAALTYLVFKTVDNSDKHCECDCITHREFKVPYI